MMILNTNYWNSPGDTRPIVAETWLAIRDIFKCWERGDIEVVDYDTHDEAHFTPNVSYGSESHSDVEGETLLHDTSSVPTSNDWEHMESFQDQSDVAETEPTVEQGPSEDGTGGLLSHGDGQAGAIEFIEVDYV